MQLQRQTTPAAQRSSRKHRNQDATAVALHPAFTGSSGIQLQSWWTTGTSASLVGDSGCVPLCLSVTTTGCQFRACPVLLGQVPSTCQSDTTTHGPALGKTSLPAPYLSPRPQAHTTISLNPNAPTQTRKGLNPPYPRSLNPKAKAILDAVMALREPGQRFNGYIPAYHLSMPRAFHRVAPGGFRVTQVERRLRLFGLRGLSRD